MLGSLSNINSVCENRRSGQLHTHFIYVCVDVCVWLWLLSQSPEGMNLFPCFSGITRHSVAALAGAGPGGSWSGSGQARLRRFLPVKALSLDSLASAPQLLFHTHKLLIINLWIDGAGNKTKGLRSAASPNIQHFLVSFTP